MSRGPHPPPALLRRGRPFQRIPRGPQRFTAPRLPGGPSRLIAIPSGAVSFLCRCRGSHPRPLRGPAAAGRAEFPRAAPAARQPPAGAGGGAPDTPFLGSAASKNFCPWGVGPVAQPGRAPPSHGGGPGFKSRPVHQLAAGLPKPSLSTPSPKHSYYSLCSVMDFTAATISSRLVALSRTLRRAL